MRLRGSSLTPSNPGTANFYGCWFPGDNVQDYGIYLSGSATAIVDGCQFGGHKNGYSIYNRFATRLSWRGCSSSDADGFMTVGPGTWNTTIPVAAASSGQARQGLVAGLYNQTLASAGAVTVTFDASYGSVYVETLNANATSSSITNAAPGQLITISWLQGTAGNFTYAWPFNCKFAGGSAPTPSTTAGIRDTVSFYYDGTNWHETSRSVAS